MLAAAFVVGSLIWGAMPLAAEIDSGKIRLRAPDPPPEAEPDRGPVSIDSPSGESARRGFDYDRFEDQILGLWFQRKLLLGQGRDEDAAEQAEAIRAFCRSEGIGRLRGLADGLLAEARDSMDGGHYGRALSALDLAEDLDPGRAQIRFARAAVAWRSGRGTVDAAGWFLSGMRASVVRGVQEFTLVNPVGFAALIGGLTVVALFALLMLARYQAPLRHEIEEWCRRAGRGGWGRPLGWAVLLLPLLVWFGAGWVALFWIALLFRFMRPAERIAAGVLLVATVCAVPAYRVAVAVFGLTQDPVVRTTLDAANAPYNPDRIVKLRELVDAHPDDATLRFLLAGLYRNGRYFPEAFDEYRRALDLDPSMYQAHVNIGNLYHRTNQYNEAIANYLDALEIRPDAVLALYNMHLSQSESFRFREANDSLERARSLDAERLSELMARTGPDETRPGVLDAEIDVGSVWSTALEGGRLQRRLQVGEPGGESVMRSIPNQFVNAVTFASLACLLVGGVLTGVGRATAPARRCVRCGRSFCHRCKSSREGHEYCSQCLHLFVLGDGLAPETKSRKLYEIERHERRTRVAGRLTSLLVPGTWSMLHGRVLYGAALAWIWFAALVVLRPQLLGGLRAGLGIDLDLVLLQAGEVPAAFAFDPWAVLAAVAAVTAWIAGNVPVLRVRRT